MKAVDQYTARVSAAEMAAERLLAAVRRLYAADARTEKVNFAHAGDAGRLLELTDAAADHASSMAARYADAGVLR